jgi:hypothetical protein
VPAHPDAAAAAAAAVLDTSLQLHQHPTQPGAQLIQHLTLRCDIPPLLQLPPASLCRRCCSCHHLLLLSSILLHHPA